MNVRPDIVGKAADPSEMRPSVWRPIHYLGSKLRLVEPIISLLDQVEPQRGRVCDLFAGSGTVSAACASTRSVTAVDIQEYSRVLCSAVLQPAAISQPKAEELVLRVRDSDLRAELLWAAAPLLAHETNCIEEARQGRYNPICDLVEGGSLVGYQLSSTSTTSADLDEALRKSSRRLRKLRLFNGARAVALRHFGGIYFSYSQAVDLAALLDVAHDCNGRLRESMLAATLSTASEIVNTVGKQFAQPIRPRDPNGNVKAHLIHKIVADRNADALAVFSRWIERYRSIKQRDHRHRVVRADYEDALWQDCDGVNVVYADPPYTRDHYSRFYHTLETMCLRDDPRIASTHPSSKETIGRGIYRVDRHQSPFCIKSQAPEAFARLFRGVQRLGVPLVLSHSPLAGTTKPRPRVIETADLVALASNFFRRVEPISAGRISHNKLNRASLNSEVSHDAELFVVCS